MEKRYEENAYVLDFLPHGRAGTRPGYRAGAVVQVIGEGFFTLLEAIVKEEFGRNHFTILIWSLPEIVGEVVNQ